MNTILRACVVSVFLGACFFAVPAYGYIDLGTGSYVLQFLAAGALGILFSIKVFWKKIVLFVKNLFK